MLPCFWEFFPVLSYLIAEKGSSAHNLRSLLTCTVTAGTTLSLQPLYTYYNLYDILVQSQKNSQVVSLAAAVLSCKGKAVPVVH
jgi:hypothetical protein